MCRLLAIRSEKLFNPAEVLTPFAHICRESKEYQGHGWGCSMSVEGKWQHYKNISPVWEDDLQQFPQTSFMLAHARSAFRDQDITVENNMPFYNDDTVFIFNGELHGVRINAEGRIGAEKIFNYILRFALSGLATALKKGTDIITRQSRYIRAMNIIMTDKKRFYVHSQFNEDKAYFTMHIKRDLDRLIICSDPLPGLNGWEALKNFETEVY